MTRKQAVLRAIELLSSDQENEEICAKLKEISEELPLAHWTEKSILDAVNQFINDNGKLPNAKDFLNVPYLPNRITLKNKLGLTMEEFYNKYYSDFCYNGSNSIYNYKEVDSMIELFKTQYIKHNRPYTRKEFDSLRDDNVPSVVTFCKILNVSTWKELLDYCGFKRKPKQRKPSINSHVTVAFDNNTKEDYITETIEIIEQINKKIG